MNRTQNWKLCYFPWNSTTKQLCIRSAHNFGPRAIHHSPPATANTRNHSSLFNMQSYPTTRNQSTSPSAPRPNCTFNFHLLKCQKRKKKLFSKCTYVDSSAGFFRGTKIKLPFQIYRALTYGWELSFYWTAPAGSSSLLFIFRGKYFTHHQSNFIYIFQFQKIGVKK